MIISFIIMFNIIIIILYEFKYWKFVLESHIAKQVKHRVKQNKNIKIQGKTESNHKQTNNDWIRISYFELINHYD